MASALPRVDTLMREGVTRSRSESGLRARGARSGNENAARGPAASARRRPLSVTTSFLGAHAMPPEAWATRMPISRWCATNMLPAVAKAGLADCVDAFCDNIGFTREQTKRVFDAAKAHGLPVKLHAEQLSNQHGAALAAQYGAQSADHLERIDEADVQRDGQVPAPSRCCCPAPSTLYARRRSRRWISCASTASISPSATDCNPGTSPLTSLLLVMNMAATLFRLTVDECLAGRHPQCRPGSGAPRQDRHAREPGKSCDLAIWNVERPAELVYRIGLNPLYQRGVARPMSVT